MNKYKKRHSDTVTATQWFKHGDHVGVYTQAPHHDWGITLEGTDVRPGDYIVELGHGEIEVYNQETFERLYGLASPKKLTIYYSVQNNGDAEFMSSRILAEWDQDHMDEGWGESCWGELDLISESPIMVEKVHSTIGYYLWKELDEYWSDEHKAEFEDEFFPTGVPKFEAKIIEGCTKYYYVFVDGVQHYKERGWTRAGGFEITEAGLLAFQNKLDKLGTK